MASDELSVPAPAAHQVTLHLGRLSRRDEFFTPGYWAAHQLHEDLQKKGWWSVDLSTLALPDDDYEYGFTLDGAAVDSDPKGLIPDPYADEIVRFGGYRGLLRIRNSRRQPRPFKWDGELQAAKPLPDNNQIVIYELPLRWMDGPEENPDDNPRQVGLGTFDKVIFERLEEIADLGVNAIELLPVEDSADSLSWGYGTRFFFAPDLDMGSPLDLKHLVKCCHQLGIRVILDVVMNHARKCPLEILANDWYFTDKKAKEEPDRPDWGARIFRYVRQTPPGTHSAREFHYKMADFWIRQYHIDGFRIDEFKGINNWDFIQEFREKAWAASQEAFPGKPFLVAAEDTGRRPEITQDVAGNPNRKRVVDAAWNFSYRDDARLLLTNTLTTVWEKSSRERRVRALVSGGEIWDGYGEGRFKAGFTDMAQAINYLTSHDVQEESERRLMNYLLAGALREKRINSGSFGDVKELMHVETALGEVGTLRRRALQQICSSFALLLTSVGIPLFLAGEEFADIHDLDPRDGPQKMGDPVDFSRAQLPGHKELRASVKDLVKLRTSHPALQRNEVECFYFHPNFDKDDSERVFAYCRTGGSPRGDTNTRQVVVIANCGPQDYPNFDFDAGQWPWRRPPLAESGEVGIPPQWIAQNQLLGLALKPFQVRVFTM